MKHFIKELLLLLFCLGGLAINIYIQNPDWIIGIVIFLTIIQTVMFIMSFVSFILERRDKKHETT